MNTIGKRIDEAPATPPAGADDATVLGSLGGEAADTQLSEAPATPARAPIEKMLEDDALALPKGALVAMRKSGGLRFTSRTVVVHRDGQVTQRSSERRRNTRPPARLSKEQLSALKRTVAKSMNAATPKSLGQQNPDAYAYEIVARVGRHLVRAEVFDGSIPTPMQDLVRTLNKYLPSSK
jgi:hypothetical protein